MSVGMQRAGLAESMFVVRLYIVVASRYYCLLSVSDPSFSESQVVGTCSLETGSHGQPSAYRLYFVLVLSSFNDPKRHPSPSFHRCGIVLF